MAYTSISGDVEIRLSKVVEYLITRSHYGDEFVKNVKKFLKEGWQPLGPAFVKSKTEEFCQTLVKYQEYTSQSTGPK